MNIKQINSVCCVGDVDGCAVQPISQSQFTPLPEALCWVIWELNLAERSTTLDDVTAALGMWSSQFDTRELDFNPKKVISINYAGLA